MLFSAQFISVGQLKYVDSFLHFHFLMFFLTFFKGWNWKALVSLSMRRNLQLILSFHDYVPELLPSTIERASFPLYLAASVLKNLGGSLTQCTCGPWHRTYRWPTAHHRSNARRALCPAQLTSGWDASVDVWVRVLWAASTRSHCTDPSRESRPKCLWNWKKKKDVHQGEDV